MKNTKLEQLRENIHNWYGNNAIRGNMKAEGELISLFQSHEAQVKQELFKKVEGIIPDDETEEENPKRYQDIMNSNYKKIITNLFKAELRSSLKALEEEEIGK